MKTGRMKTGRAKKRRGERHDVWSVGHWSLRDWSVAEGSRRRRRVDARSPARTRHANWHSFDRRERRGGASHEPRRHAEKVPFFRAFGMFFTRLGTGLGTGVNLVGTVSVRVILPRHIRSVKSGPEGCPPDPIPPRLLGPSGRAEVARASTADSDGRNAFPQEGGGPRTVPPRSEIAPPERTHPCRRADAAVGSPSLAEARPRSRPRPALADRPDRDRAILLPRAAGDPRPSRGVSANSEPA